MSLLIRLCDTQYIKIFRSIVLFHLNSSSSLPFSTLVGKIARFGQEERLGSGGRLLYWFPGRGIIGDIDTSRLDRR